MSLTCEGHGRCRREELEGELARFTRLQNEAGETLQGQLEEWERAERAEAERDGWKERAESSEHNFGVLHDELAALRAAPAAPEEDK